MKKGHTLIELLVVVTIIGILAAIGIASYNDFNERRKVKKAAEELKLYIRLAASKAMNNEKDCDSGNPNHCAGGDNICATEDDLILAGWYIDFSTSPPEIYGECGGTTFPTPAISLTGLSGFSISLNPAPSGNRIQFYPLAQGTDLGGDLTITVSRGGEEFFLIVAPSGNVSGN